MPQQQHQQQIGVATLGPITRAAAHAAASTSQCGGAPSTSAPAAGDSTGYGGGKRRSGSGGGGEVSKLRRIETSLKHRLRERRRDFERRPGRGRAEAPQSPAEAALGTLPDLVLGLKLGLRLLVLAWRKRKRKTPKRLPKEAMLSLLFFSRSPRTSPLSSLSRSLN